jgi:hypothetical protein
LCCSVCLRGTRNHQLRHLCGLTIHVCMPRPIVECRRDPGTLNWDAECVGNRQSTFQALAYDI